MIEPAISRSVPHTPIRRPRTGIAHSSSAGSETSWTPSSRTRAAWRGDRGIAFRVHDDPCLGRPAASGLGRAAVVRVRAHLDRPDRARRARLQGHAQGQHEDPGDQQDTRSEHQEAHAPKDVGRRADRRAQSRPPRSWPACRASTGSASRRSAARARRRRRPSSRRRRCPAKREPGASPACDHRRRQPSSSADAAPDITIGIRCRRACSTAGRISGRPVARSRTRTPR